MLTSPRCRWMAAVGLAVLTMVGAAGAGTAGDGRPGAAAGAAVMSRATVARIAQWRMRNIFSS
mgnify:CR=1 FL=1